MLPQMKKPTLCKACWWPTAQTDSEQLAKWPLKKAVMLYLTVHKPTHFLCYPFVRGLQKSFTYVTILQTSLQRTWLLTVQYLFHFQLPFPERSPSETSTNATTREKKKKNSPKRRFCFFSSRRRRHHAGRAPQGLQAAISRAQYLRINKALKVPRYLFGSTNAATFLRRRCLITLLLAYCETARRKG